VKKIIIPLNGLRKKKIQLRKREKIIEKEIQAKFKAPLFKPVSRKNSSGRSFQKKSMFIFAKNRNDAK
jgi:hypothetical protein